MFRKNDNEYTFTANKVNYTVENLDKTIEVYQTDNPSKTGFIFNGGLKSFILFINNITDIAEDLSKDEAK